MLLPNQRRFHTVFAVSARMAAKSDRSRDEAALGSETLHRFAQLDVLIVGMRGLGVEVAKNVMLSGPKSVTLFDPEPTRMSDTGVNFYLHAPSIGTPRAVAAAAQLSELNSLVRVSVCAHTELDDATVARHHVVVFTNAPRAQLLRWNEFCRSRRIVFLATSVHGVAGFAFSDFTHTHTITDADGTQPRAAVVTFITQDEANPAVNTDDSMNKRHGFTDGEYVVFREVEGMPGLNGSGPYRITDCKPFSFRLQGVNTASMGVYEGGGVVTTVKVPTTASYISLKESITHPRKDPAAFGGLATPDLGKFGQSEQLHIAFHALEQFRDAHGRLPGLRNAEDAAEVLRLATAFNAQLKADGAEVSVETVNDKLVTRVAQLATVEFPPLNAFFGGLVAQEVMKVTGKFTPLNGWLYFDAFEVLPDGNDELPPAEYAPADARDDDVVAIFGRSFQRELTNKRVFLVGAGALGCELLKAFALAGIGTGSAGHVTVTDMDRIELSNLSRQFLYRREHVGQPKSVTSAAAAVAMNPDMKVQALTIAVGTNTESVFNDEFWSRLDLVVNALDNVEARKYVDGQCILYQKPLLESGTLGTQANTQVIVPQLTESYGDGQDPPEESIPMCTVREFPYFIEHCIEWARTLFAEEFHDGLREAVSFIESPDAFLEREQQEVSVKPAPERLSRIVDVVKLALSPSLEKLVHHARIMFEENFYIKQRKQLQLPIDFVDPVTGMKFWSGHKRPPTAHVFDVENDLHRDFIIHAVSILADAFRVPLAEGWDTVPALKPLLASATVPVFVAKEMMVKEENGASVLVEKASADGTDASLAAERDARAALDLLSSLLREHSAAVIQALCVRPVSFEKDDDSNHHVDCLTAATNLRAANYNIGSASAGQVRLIAGKIIPAIATTTCLVTGLVATELYKVIAGAKVEKLRNAFLNTAINNFSLSEPPGPPRTRSSKMHPMYKEPVRAIPDAFTVWDRFDFRDRPDLTPHQLAEWLQETHKVKLMQVFARGATNCSYDEAWRNAKTKAEKGAVPLRVLYERALKTTVEPGKKFLIFLVNGRDEAGVLVLLPNVFVYL